MGKYYIGIDGGGSKTHAVLTGSDNQVIADSYSGSANINSDLNLAYASIIDAIDQLILPSNIKLQDISIGIGVAGYSNIDNRKALLNLLTNSDFNQVKLESDCHIACLAAHGVKDGGVIICGTGVVAYFICNNEAKQIGGWGFPHGDLGGAAWIGLEICKLLCKAIDHVIPWTNLLNEVFVFFNKDNSKYKDWLLKATPKHFAEIAKFLLQYFEDPVAKVIYEHALNEVYDFTKAILQQTTNNLPIKLMGGLAKVYIDPLADKFGSISLCDVDPAIGALYLIKK